MRNLFFILILSSLTTITSGQSFTELNGPFGGKVTNIAYDGANSKLYAVVNRQLFASADNGVNWNRIIVPANSYGIDDVVLDGTKLIGLSTAKQIIMSTDGGVNWTVQNPFVGGFESSTSYFKLIKHPATGVLVILGDGRIELSTDNGATTKTIHSYAFGGVSLVPDLDVTPSGDLFAWDANVGLIKYPQPATPTDPASWSAAGWSTVFPKPWAGTDYWTDIGVTTNNRILFNHMSAAGNETLVELSADGGATWQVQTLGASYTASETAWAGSPNGKMYYFVNGPNTVWEFTEGAGTPWVSKPWPTATIAGENVLCAVWKSNTQAFAGSIKDGVFATSNAGNSWAISSTGLKFGEGNQVEITADGKILVVLGYLPEAYWYSTDQGVTWITQSFPYRIYKLYRLPDNTLIITTDASRTFTSTDGLNWTEHANPPGVMTIKEIVIVASNDIYAFGSDGTVWESLDKGTSWSQITITGGPSATEYFTAATRDDDGYFYAHTSDNLNATKYYRFDSNALPWTTSSFSVDAQNFIPFALFSLNNKIYVSSSGLKVSSDRGATWTVVDRSADVVIPLRQGALTGLAIAHEGYLSVTQTEGQTFINIPIAQPKGRITDISLNAAGTKYIASAQNSPALEFAISPTNRLLLPTAEIPQYIDFNWQSVAGGPFGGDAMKVVKSASGQLFTFGGSKIYRYNSSASAWESIRDFYVSDAFIDVVTDKIYFVGGSSILVTADNGATFSTLDVGGVGLLTILVDDVGNIFVAGVSGFYRSTDNGASFAKLDNGIYSQLAMSTNGILITVKDKTIFRSADKGKTWSAATGIDLATVNFVSGLNALEGGKLTAVTNNNIYKSSDEGLTFSPMLGDIPTGPSFSIISGSKVYLSPTNEYWFVHENNAGATIYASSNGGSSWTKKTDITSQVLSLTWNGTDIYAGTSSYFPSLLGQGVLKSSDNGATFTPFQANKGFANNRFDGLELFKTKLFAISNNELFASADKGATFTSVASVSTSVSGLLKLPDGSMIAYGKGIYKTGDGVTWSQVTASGDFKLITASSASLFYAFSANYEFQSSTNLTTWSTLAMSGLPQFAEAKTMVSDASGVLYFTTATTQAYQFASGSLANLPLPLGNLNGFLRVGNTIFLYTSNGVLYSTTDGLTWTSKPVPQGNKMLITDLNYYFVSQGQGLLLVSRDQGLNWQSVGTPAQTVNFESILVDEFTGFAYASAQGNAVLKSSSMVLLNDNQGATPATLSPANLATGILPTATLSITFNEAVTPVAGKKIKIVEPTNTSAFVESFDVATGVQSGKTFTFTPAATSLKYSNNSGSLQSYYITLEAGAFSDLFGNTTIAIINDATWKFSMAVTPDATPPAISFDNTGQKNYLNIQDNSKAVQATITDNIGVTQAQIFYRAITSNAAFTTSSLTKTSGNLFEFAVPSSAYGPIGLEFYLTAADAVGNTTRSPASGVYYAYKKVDAAKPTLGFALPAGTQQEHYRIISNPYASSNNTVEAVLEPALSQHDSKIWRLLTLDTEDQSWMEYPKDFTSIESGVGYWMIYKNGGAISLGVETTPLVTKTTPASLVLKPQWNQIGNPYPFTMAWSEVLAANNNPSGIGTPKIFNGSGYVTSDNIQATEGAFVYNSGGADVTLTIPLVTSTSGGRLKQSISSDLGQSEWIVPVSLKSHSLQTDIGGVGMSEKANVSIDDLDDFNPPPFHHFLQMAFPHPEHRARFTAQDVVDPRKNYVWNFTVNTDVTEAIELSWNNEALGDNSNELYLFDVALQTPVNMREGARYVFDPKVSASFRIYFGENVEEQIQPDFILLGNAYPNPSAGLTTIPFALPDDNSSYKVMLEMFDMLGNKVSTLHEGETLPGFHSISWDAENVNDGIYLYRLQVSAPHGQSLQTKKIVLKR